MIFQVELSKWANTWVKKKKKIRINGESVIQIKGHHAYIIR